MNFPFDFVDEGTRHLESILEEEDDLSSSLRLESGFIEYSQLALEEGASAATRLRPVFAGKLSAMAAVSGKLRDRHQSDFFLLNGTNTGVETFGRGGIGLLDDARYKVEVARLSRLFLNLSRLLQNRSLGDPTLDKSSAKHCLCLDLND